MSTRFNVSGCRTLFFLLVTRSNVVRVIKGKNHTEMIRKGNKNYFELEGGSAYQELKLPKGQITVNV